MKELIEVGVPIASVLPILEGRSAAEEFSVDLSARAEVVNVAAAIEQSSIITPEKRRFNIAVILLVLNEMEALPVPHRFCLCVSGCRVPNNVTYCGAVSIPPHFVLHLLKFI